MVRAADAAVKAADAVPEKVVVAHARVGVVPVKVDAVRARVGVVPAKVDAVPVKAVRVAAACRPARSL